MSIRLLKVVVQPVYVTDDGDLAEVIVQPVTLTAAQWRALDPQGWAEEGAAQIDAQLAPRDMGVISDVRQNFDVADMTA